ncbi:MAG: ferredoxin--nitrite reductase [Rhizobiales bacterium 32-66-8]|nr:MAG: ferredoxin--nitrite reductase [Rhizobiales bacterium 32-66-8]
MGALEDTNDIGFQAVEVIDGFGVAPGIWLRLVLGGITGHRDFARDTGIVVRPEEAVDVAAAIVRAFIDTGDRTDRKKARLKYVLDDWGFERFLSAVEAKLGRPLVRVPTDAIAPRAVPDRMAHLGVHAQKQAGLNWIGIGVPVGRLTVAQMRGLADIAHGMGDGDLRLTVWQNLLLSGVPDVHVAAVLEVLEGLGLSARPSVLQAGIVACTGARGCRFGNADTKGTARAIQSHCEPRLALDLPVNIHVTGCHNSCAQHYIGDIGLIGARVAINEEGDSVDGYHLLVGGGFGAEAAIADELYRDVTADAVPPLVEKLLNVWMAHRMPDEPFARFTRRLPAETLKALVDADPAA